MDVFWQGPWYRALHKGECFKIFGLKIRPNGTEPSHRVSAGFPDDNGLLRRLNGAAIIIFIVVVVILIRDEWLHFIRFARGVLSSQLIGPGHPALSQKENTQQQQQYDQNAASFFHVFFSSLVFRLS
jgi:hypothetical protein